MCLSDFSFTSDEKELGEDEVKCERESEEQLQQQQEEEEKEEEEVLEEEEVGPEQHHSASVETEPQPSSF